MTRKKINENKNTENKRNWDRGHHKTDTVKVELANGGLKVQS